MRNLMPLFICLLLLLMACTEQGNNVEVEVDVEYDEGRMAIDTTRNLVVWYPQYTYIDLACGVMPRVNDGAVVMCLPAADTRSQGDSFSHEDIAGDHVASGMFEKGFNCPTNTGTFTYHDSLWCFIPSGYTDSIARTADSRGMAFSQVMLVYKSRPLPAKIKGRKRFRAICEKDGKLCVAESRKLQDVDFFVRCLTDYGMRHALNLQSSPGWNYSYYRDNNGVVHIMHPQTEHNASNWLTFYLLERPQP